MHFSNRTCTYWHCPHHFIPDHRQHLSLVLLLSQLLTQVLQTAQVQWHPLYKEPLQMHQAACCVVLVRYADVEHLKQEFI